jgi:hypothetical protein
MERTKAKSEKAFEERLTYLTATSKRKQALYRKGIGFFTRQKKHPFLFPWLLRKAREELEFFPVPVPRSAEANESRKRLMVIFEIFAFIAPTARPGEIIRLLYLPEMLLPVNHEWGMVILNILKKSGAYQDLRKIHVFMELARKVKNEKSRRALRDASREAAHSIYLRERERPLSSALRKGMENTYRAIQSY